MLSLHEIDTIVIKEGGFLCQYPLIAVGISPSSGIGNHLRAGEFPKKNFYHGQNRVFGPKNAPKKFGSPTPNFPPPQFGK